MDETKKQHLFPTCQVRVVRFYERLLLLLLLLLLLVLLLLASSRSHWASPDLNRQLTTAVGMSENMSDIAC